MLVRLVILSLLLLTSCSSPNVDQLVSLKLGSTSETQARDMLEEIYRAAPGAYRLYYYHRDGRKAYIMTAKKGRLTASGHIQEIRIVDETEAASAGISRRYRCILESNCSQDDDSFCTFTTDLSGPLGGPQQDTVAAYLRERAYPVNYISFDESADQTSITVQYYTDCQYLSKDLQLALVHGGLGDAPLK